MMIKKLYSDNSFLSFIQFGKTAFAFFVFIVVACFWACTDFAPLKFPSDEEIQQMQGSSSSSAVDFSSSSYGVSSSSSVVSSSSSNGVSSSSSVVSSSSSDNSSSSAEKSKCGDIPANSFCDSRDGKVYKWVNIGNQKWMAENLNLDTTDVKHHDEKYGMFYNWDMANKYCPAGWHLPSQNEWIILRNFIENNETNCSSNCAATATYLKEAGSNSFSALLGGYYYNSLESVDQFGYWWSSDNYSNDKAYAIVIGNLVSVNQTEDKSNFLSVRCLK